MAFKLVQGAHVRRPIARSREAATASNHRLSCVAGIFARALAFSSPATSRLVTMACLAYSQRFQRNSARLTPFTLSCNKGLSRVAAQANALHADEARVDEMVKLVAYGIDGRSKRGKHGIRVAGGPNGENAGF